MIIDELVVHNVGTFVGRQALRLTPPSPSRPITLVGGLNGTGKTTLLEAVHLALYGPLAQLNGRRTGSYDAHLRSLISHGVPAHEGATVELAFHIYQEGVAHSYRVARSWRDTGAAVREQLAVEVDGWADDTLAATWAEHVEAFLPRGIAGLFFFDGEQIEALADLDRSSQVLRTAVNALLGLDVLDRLATDLVVVRRRHRGAGVPDELRREMGARRDVLTVARQAEEATASEVAGLRVEVERANKRVFAATERYRTAGGELADQRERVEADLSVLVEGLAVVESELRELAGGAAPLAQVSELLAEVAAQARTEASGVREQVVLDAIDARDKALLAELRRSHVRAATVIAVDQFLSADRDRRRTAATVPVVTALAEPAALEFLVSTALPESARRAADLLNRRHDLRTKIEVAERLVAAVPDPDAIAGARTDRDTAQRELLRAEAALGHAEERLGALQHEGARALGAYEAATEETARAALAADDDRRLVDHVDRVDKTLKVLKSAVTRRHLDRICDLVLEALGRLLRKHSLVTGIRIDPETFSVQLSGSSGRPLATTELSAGERQLLAVALLWGLARGAGQPLPVIIDTPLGRLDSSHREHLVDRYFPQASHQVVLLSTNTEIGEEEYRRLQRSIGHAYMLEFDSDRASTKVVPGYFWEG